MLVSFGERVAFGSTLQEALTRVFNTNVETGEPTPNQPTPNQPPASQTVKQALAQAQAAYAAAEEALKNQDLAEYQKQVKLMKAAIDRAVAAGATPTTPVPSGAPTTTPPTPAPTSTPSPTG